MARNIRIVKPGEDGKALEDISMATAIEELMRKMIAAQPTVVFVAWEVNNKLTNYSIPESTLLKKGMVQELYEQFFESIPDDLLPEE